MENGVIRVHNMPCPSVFYVLVPSCISFVSRFILSMICCIYHLLQELFALTYIVRMINKRNLWNPLYDDEIGEENSRLGSVRNRYRKLCTNMMYATCAM